MPRLSALAILLVAVLLATPAAGAQTAPAVVVAPLVSARDALAVTLTDVAGAVSVTLVDAAGSSAGWTFTYDDTDDAASPRELALDLAAPATGTEPVNGAAMVTVAAADVVLHEAQVVLDRDPVTPALTATVSGRRVDASWEAAGGPGVVTYRLERSYDGGAWSIVSEAAHATAFRDGGLAPGPYRYRLTAFVAGADGQMNASPARLASAEVAPPGEPSEDSTENPPEESGPEDDAAGEALPRTQRPARDKAPTAESRRVAAAGAVTRGIAERRGAGRLHARRQYSDAPAFGSLRAATLLLQHTPDPRVAASLQWEAPPTAASRPDRVAPALAPRAAPSAPLVIATGAAAPPALPGPVPVAAGLLVLLLSAHLAAWRRTVNLAEADPR